MAIFRQRSPNGSVECRRYENRDFLPISRYISEIIQDMAIVTIEDEYETVPKLSNGTILMTLPDP